MAEQKKFLDAEGLKYLWNKIEKKSEKIEIIDNLTSTAVDKALSAKQGKVLNDKIAAIIDGSQYVQNAVDADSALYATEAGSVAWGNVSGKPSSYYTLPTATKDVLGGIKIGYTATINNGTSYVAPVELDTNSNKAYVTISKSGITGALGYTPANSDNVKTYGVATDDTLGLIKTGYSEFENFFAVQVNNQNRAFVKVPLSDYATQTWVENKGYVTTNVIKISLTADNGTISSTDLAILKARPQHVVFERSGYYYFAENLSDTTTWYYSCNVFYSGSQVIKRVIAINTSRGDYSKSDYTYTPNTVGATNKASTTLYLVGVSGGASNTPKESNINTKCYIGSDNYLYSNGSKVLTSHQSLSGYATETWVNTQIAALVNSAPTTLDTLGELATALENHKDAYGALLETVGNKLDKSGGEISGHVTIDSAYAIKADNYWSKSGTPLMSWNGTSFQLEKTLYLKTDNTNYYLNSEYGSASFSEVDIDTSLTFAKGAYIQGTANNGSNYELELPSKEGIIALTSDIPSVVNNLTSTSTSSSLSAAQGKALNDKFANYLLKSGGTINGDLNVTDYIWAEELYAGGNDDVVLGSSGIYTSKNIEAAGWINAKQEVTIGTNKEVSMQYDSSRKALKFVF